YGWIRKAGNLRQLTTNDPVIDPYGELSRIGLDDQESAWLEMFSHGADCLVKSRGSSQVTNGAKEANDDIEPFSQIKVDHVGFVEHELWVLFPRQLEHGGIEIESFNSVVLTQIGDVTSGSNAHVEEIGASRVTLLNHELSKLLRFGLVVFPGVDRIVEGCRLGKHVCLFDTRSVGPTSPQSGNEA